MEDMVGRMTNEDVAGKFESTERHKTCRKDLKSKDTKTGPRKERLALGDILRMQQNLQRHLLPADRNAERWVQVCGGYERNSLLQEPAKRNFAFSVENRRTSQLTSPPQPIAGGTFAGIAATAATS